MTFDLSNFREVQDNIPDELPEGGQGFTGAYRVVKMGFFQTPGFKQAAAQSRGENPQDRMFMMALEPLDFSFDTDPTSWIYEQQGNLAVTWAKYRDKNGRDINPNSPFGDIKKFFRDLGYKIRTQEDCKTIEGKVFRFLTSSKSYAGEGSKAVWTDKPIEELHDYIYTGPLPKPIRKRGYAAGTESAATRIDPVQEQVDAQKLVAALEGKGRKQFLTALVAAGFDDPYIGEAAANDGEALIQRMTRYGMAWNGEALVNGS